MSHYSLPWEALFSAIRGFAFGAGLYKSLGLGFALAFGALITLGQVFAYARGMRPAMDYEASRRARLTRRQFWATVARTIGYIATALICSTLVHHVDHAWAFAIRVGLVTGLVTGIGTTVIPYIEYYADNLPARRLGAFGIGLIFCGFALQSFQYWLALFDVRITRRISISAPREENLRQRCSPSRNATPSGLLSSSCWLRRWRFRFSSCANLHCWTMRTTLLVVSF